jgi:hypothetical protein
MALLPEETAMAYVKEDECAAANLDPKKVASVARRISRAAMDAKAMGLVVFGGSGSGSLRFNDGGDGQLIVAELDGPFDGGDGATWNKADGLLRGQE